MLTNLDTKTAALWVCVLFTLLTVTSSAWHVLQGVEHDTHLHLLVRFAVTVVGVGSIWLFATLRRRFRRAAAAKAAGCAYVISMATVLVMTWGFGRLEPLHPDAYGDIVSNFTGIWIVVALVVTLAPPARQRLRDLVPSRSVPRPALSGATVDPQDGGTT